MRTNIIGKTRKVPRFLYPRLRSWSTRLPDSSASPLNSSSFRGRTRKLRDQASRRMPSDITNPFAFPLGDFRSAVEYMVDSAQRNVLFWDVMRQRGNQYREHLAETAPHVLDYQVKLVIDGRKLNRPVNYALAWVVPPAGVTVDSKKRPFVVA